MKKLKLFSKTYIFTVGLISLIIFTSNILIYLAVPRVYLSNKEKEADIIISELTQKINEENSEKSFELAKGFAQKYNIQVFITLGEEQRSFQGVENVDIYIDKDVIKDKSLILPDLTGEGIIKSSEEEEVDSINEGIFSQYINVNNSSIIKSRDFKTINDVKGNIQIVTNLESFTETRDIILKILPYSMIVSLIVALIASYIYAKKITTPIKEICNVESEDEIGILAYNINSLYENLLNTIISLEEEIKNVSESEKVKVDFLRSASHELKTPLMSMHIMIENMLYDIGKYKNHYVYLEKCKDIVNELSKMVQEILDTSRLNSIENKNEKLLDLSYIVENALDHYNIIAKSKNINIKVNLNDSFNIKVDEKVFTKAISNIISNAVNYTDEGKEIRVYIKDKKLIIENDCKPISDEHLAHIFEAFYRVDFDRNKSSGGNGLGLYIVEQILRMYNLSFSFKSISTGMRFEIDFN